jgi:beta-galactosidase
MFFQMRQSVGGQEKFHGAVISHAGHGDTRVFRECTQLGEELDLLGGIFLEGRIQAKVGILFDWNNWWALELSSGPSKDMDYLKTAAAYYKAFYDRNIPVDILNVSSDLSSYSLIVAPMLYMIKEGVAEHIDEFVQQGGTFVATTMSGLVDENDRCIFGEYPGKLKKILGVWVEETDALFPEERNIMLMAEESRDFKKKYECSFLCDILHPLEAQVLAVYGRDFYENSPCLTMNSYGKGKAYYIGTQPEESFLADFFENLCNDLGIKPVYSSDRNVEITNRITEQESVVFVINHNSVPANVDFGNDNLMNLFTGEAVHGVTTVNSRDVQVLHKLDR